MVRFVIDEAHRIIWYDNWVGYEDGNTAVVDDMFRSPELEEHLERRNLKPRWKSGVYDQLLSGKPPEKAVDELKHCRVWQFKPEAKIGKRFLDFEKLVDLFGPPDSEDYRVVYDGQMGTDDLEEIYHQCNIDHPKGYKGWSMSMGDVVELYDDKTSEFYYCDRKGFRRIEFAKEAPEQIQTQQMTM